MTDNEEMDTRRVPNEDLALSVGEAELRKAAFVIPLDAPLPNEFSQADIPSGSLLSRLKYLDDVTPENGFAFIPLSGPEFMALDRAWHSLQTRKQIYVLTELPGAKYDVLFDTARRSIGLRTVDWPSVDEAMDRYVTALQRTKDTTPWELNKRKRTGDPAARAPIHFNPDEMDRLPPPPADTDDADT